VDTPTVSSDPMGSCHAEIGLTVEPKTPFAARMWIKLRALLSESVS